MKSAFIVLVTLLVFASGCAEFLAREPKLDYQKVIATGRTHTRRASIKNRVGLELLKEHNFEGAELAFQQALIADSTYGPAHNNLGKLYYQQGDNYLAAREFEEARRLMSECSQPINNLGLIYYEVDKFDEAIEYFQQAYGFCQTDPEYLGNLVRARVRRGDRTYDLRQQIEALQLIENRPDWKDWEAEQLAFGKIDNIVTEEVILAPVVHQLSPFQPNDIELPEVRSPLENPLLVEPYLEPSLPSPPVLDPFKALPGSIKSVITEIPYE